jgi:hypothetical protein
MSSTSILQYKAPQAARDVEKAAHALKMASGATMNQYQPPSQQLEAIGKEGDADDKNENDENDNDGIPKSGERKPATRMKMNSWRVPTCTV